MPRPERMRRNATAECPAESFEVSGDADALPDEFFDALAALLLDIHETESRDEAEEEAA